jgi:hypothetical protein
MTCPCDGQSGWYMKRVPGGWVRTECWCGASDRAVAVRQKEEASSMFDAGGRKEMKCVTVCQPWASGIIASDKDIENRSWYTNHRGLLLIHAGMSKQWFGSRGAKELPGLPQDESLPRGLILGVVTLKDCQPVAEVAGYKYAEGPFCWLLVDRKAFPKPVAFTGAQGLFNVPVDVVAEQLKAVGVSVETVAVAP